MEDIEDAAVQSRSQPERQRNRERNRGRPSQNSKAKPEVLKPGQGGRNVVKIETINGNVNIRRAR